MATHTVVPTRRVATHATGTPQHGYPRYREGASHAVTHVVLTHDAPDGEEKRLADPSLSVDR